MKKIVGIIAVLFVTFSFGQDKPKDWTFLKDFNGVNIYYKYSECDYNRGLDQEFVVIKMENTTDSTVSLSYWVELTYNSTCKTCGEDEYYYGVILSPNTSIEGSCTLGVNQGLQYFSKFTDFTNIDKLTSFKLAKLATGANGQNCKIISK